jgi:hypothetical protein
LPLKDRKYKPDVAFLKGYGNGKYRITIHAWLRTPGIEDDEEYRHLKGKVNDEKLETSLIHTRSTIFELAFCNTWGYFVTFTLDKEKFDRYNLAAFNRAFSQWIKNINKKNGTNIKYLIVPERHKDGAWHEHGFIYGVPEDQIKPFTLKQRLPKHIREKLKKNQPVYEWPAYREKFGFCDLEPIKSQEAASRYVTKYITKELSRSVTKVNAHMYYCSKGCHRLKHCSILHVLLMERNTSFSCFDFSKHLFGLSCHLELT